MHPLAPRFWSLILFDIDIWYILNIRYKRQMEIRLFDSAFVFFYVSLFFLLSYILLYYPLASRFRYISIIIQ